MPPRDRKYSIPTFVNPKLDASGHVATRRQEIFDPNVCLFETRCLRTPSGPHGEERSIVGGAELQATGRVIGGG